MRAAISTRVSTDDQVQGASLDVQEAACREYIEHHGWKLIGVFTDDGVSGSKVDFDDRPAFSRLLKAAPDVVVVQDSDRFGRNEYFWHKLLHFHPEIRLVSLDGKIDTADQSKGMTQSFFVAIGADEAKKITMRTMRGRVAKARKQVWPGGKAPYAMSIEDSLLVEEPTEAAIVRDAAAWVLDGLSTAKVAARLNAEERFARPKKSGEPSMRWTSLAIRRMLKNSALRGHVEWTSKKAVELGLMAEGEVFLIPAPSILGDETWAVLQERLASSASEWRGDAKIAVPKVYPLSRRLFTTEGHSMAGAYNKAKDRRRYRCSGRNSRWPEERIKHPHCHEVNADLVEELVWREVSEHLGDTDWLMSLAGLDTIETDAERRSRDVRIGELLRDERELERLRKEAFIDGKAAGLTPDEIRAVVEDYGASLTAKQDERAMLEEMQQNTGLRDEQSRRLMALAKASFKWMSEPAFQKRVYEALDLEVEIVAYEPLRIRLRGKVSDRLDTLTGALSRRM